MDKLSDLKTFKRDIKRPNWKLKQKLHNYKHYKIRLLLAKDS